LRPTFFRILLHKDPILSLLSKLGESPSQYLQLVLEWIMGINATITIKNNKGWAALLELSICPYKSRSAAVTLTALSFVLVAVPVYLCMGVNFYHYRPIFATLRTISTQHEVQGRHGNTGE
jgi:hypothetical protein